MNCVANWLRFNYNSVGVSQVPAALLASASPASLHNFLNIASAPYISSDRLLQPGIQPDGPQPRIDSTYELADNFSKVVGSHTMKFGFDGKRYDVEIRSHS